jgi:hypothetical protein
MASEQLKEFFVHLGTGAVSATVSKTFIAPIERSAIFAAAPVQCKERIAAAREAGKAHECVDLMHVNVAVWLQGQTLAAAAVCERADLSGQEVQGHRGLHAQSPRGTSTCTACALYVH